MNKTISLKEIINIENKIKRYVIGQDEHIKTILSFIYRSMNHSPDTGAAYNLMLIGSSGSGKTYIMKKIAEYLNKEFFVIDATKVSVEGYKGLNLSEILEGFISSKGKEALENGIVFIDEVDKLGMASEYDNFYSVGRQSAFLTLLNHDVIKIKRYEIDTRNMIIIAAGAFSGILNNKEEIGIIKNNKKNEYTALDISEYLIKQNYSVEFIGRFSTFVILNNLKDKDYLKILENKLNNDYKQFLEDEGIELEITNNAKKLMLKKLVNAKIGARTVDCLLEEIIIPNLINILRDITVCKLRINAQNDQLLLEKEYGGKRKKEQSNNKSKSFVFKAYKDIDMYIDEIMRYMYQECLNYDDFASCRILLKVGFLYMFIENKTNTTTLKRFISENMFSEKDGLYIQDFTFSDKSEEEDEMKDLFCDYYEEYNEKCVSEFVIEKLVRAIEQFEIEKSKREVEKDD